MHLSQLGAAAAIAAVGQAFLLPPTIAPADNDIIKTLPVDAAISADGRVIQIACPGCPVEITNLEGMVKSAVGTVDSQLRFNFSIEHGDVDQLLLNGLQLYPIDPSVLALGASLTADQLVKTPAGSWNYASSPRLGYSMSVSSPELSPDQQLGLISVKIQIQQLGQTFMNGFPTMEVKLLETPSRKLMIGDVAIKAAQAPTEAGQECTSILCKWRAIVAAKLAQLKASKGCGGARPKHEITAAPGGISSHPASIVKDGPMIHVKPHHGHHGGHRAHRHRHRHGGFARFLRGIVFHVFVPIMIGIVVGIMASLVGMVVGHIAIFIWRMLFRRGERASCRRIRHEESISKDDEDSKSLLGHDNPPPVYEEAPAYEDAVVEEKA